MFSMAITYTNSSLSVAWLSSRSQLLFLEKKCYCSSAFIYGSILFKLFTNKKFYNILYTFEFDWLVVLGLTAL